MSKLENLLRKAPWLIGAKNPERWLELLLPAFKKELEDLNSVFAAKPNEPIQERLEVLHSLYWAVGADEEKTAFFILIVILKATTCAIHKGRTDLIEEHKGRKQDLEDLVSQDPERYAAILDEMSIEEAATNGEWD